MDAGPAADVPPEGLRAVVVDGTGLVLGRCEGVLRAIEDRCSHDDGPLGEGSRAACEVICPRHGARFDLRDGRATRMPAVRAIRSYPAREEGGRILVDLGDA